MPAAGGPARTTVPGGVTPGEAVYTENKLTLYRYVPEAGPMLATPVVLVSAVINRPSILDFEADRSVVRRFLDAGFETYLLDWGEPSRLDASLTMDDYVGRYLANVAAVVTDLAGTIPHLFGYCTGGTLAAVFTALHTDRVKTLGLLAPVLAFDSNDGILQFWGDEAAYDPRELVATFGNAPGTWLTGEFTMVAPADFLLGRYLDLAEHGHDLDYVDRFVRRTRWGYDAVDVAGGLYEQFLVDLYRDDSLLGGTLTVAGERVDVAAIDVPVLDVLGRDDRFIPAAASLPFLDAIAASDTEAIEFPTDHVGLSVSEAAHESLWPRVCEWLSARSVPQSDA